ncbi:MAG TPA: AsmA family protein [Candidatus Acidoferrales bacterium]|nr:AsmA family protein [Candidatus Acidoferrales bacterium]
MDRPGAAKRSLLAALALLLLAAALLLWALDRMIAHNRDYVLARASERLHRHLSAGAVGLRIGGGIKLRLADLVMADDPAFSPDEFIRADEFLIELRLLPLLRRKAEIERLTLRNPQIRLHRNAQGVFNFSTIGQKNGQARAPRLAGASARASESPTSVLGPVPRLQITGGSLRFTDKKERIDLPLEKIALAVEESGEHLIVEFSAAFFSAKPNLKLRARVRATGDAMALADAPLDARLTIEALDTAKLKRAVPKIRSYFPGLFDSSGSITIKDMRLNGTLGELNLLRFIPR